MCYIEPSSNVFIFVRLKESEVHTKASLFQEIWYIMQGKNHLLQKNAHLYRKTNSNFKEKKGTKMIDPSSSYQPSSI